MMRWAWYGCLLVLALLATATELDVMSRYDVRVVSYIPGPFRNYAQTRVTEMALAGPDPRTALAEARTLVQRRPIPTDSLFLLASAYQFSGDEHNANEAFAQSTARGWRNPVVEQIMVATALQHGDIATAAAHLLALWSLGIDTPERDSLTQQVLAAPGGAEAYGKLLATSHFAQDAAMQGATTLVPTRDFVRMVHAAIVAGARFDCSRLTTQAGVLARQGDTDEAALLASPSCPPGPVYPRQHQSKIAG